MNNHAFTWLIAMIALSLSFSCHREPVAVTKTNMTTGSLFIMGGGYWPELIDDLVSLAIDDPSDYVYILPQASSEPDSAFYYSSTQFIERGISQVFKAYSIAENRISDPGLDSIRNADLIYISGGDQARFMELVGNSPLQDALWDAYERGAVIAGTSAGAAVMSKQMITGNQYKYPEYTGYFRTIEANNIELVPGLGFLSSEVIDQHFVKRMRFNRLLSVVLEHPDLTGIGIDENTALFIKGNRGVVFGSSQVLVIRSTQGNSQTNTGLLGANGVQLDVLLPGDTILLY